MSNTPIDLSQLPAPQIIAPLDFQTIFDAMRDDLKARLDDFDALVESEPIWKLLEVAAYRELMLRARINDACRGVMLAYATGTNLDNLAAFYGVKRQVINPGDETAIPPIDATFESDERLRQRIQFSLEGYSTAGTIGSYRFHVLAASAQVKDVTLTSPEPGKVVITVLSSEGQGVPDDALIEIVNTKLNAKDIRPLTDWVQVQKAQIIYYQVAATLYLADGPDAQLIRGRVIQALWAMVKAHHYLGKSIALSQLYATLHQTGVERVKLQSPTMDILVESDAALWCDAVMINIGNSHA